MHNLIIIVLDGISFDFSRGISFLILRNSVGRERHGKPNCTVSQHDTFTLFMASIDMQRYAVQWPSGQEM